MADIPIKISALTAATAALGADELAINEAGTSKKLTVDQISTYIGASGGAPTTADYLVGTADAGLSAEIVVGTSPGGELGGTWASPTVDATHSGSTHAAALAAAEATAAGALSGHTGDTTDAHDASAISILDTANDFTATDVEGALVELQTDAEADATALSDHVADAAAAHAASAIAFTPNGTIAATDVQAAIQEVRDEAGAGGGPTTLFVHYADAGNVTTGETDLYSDTLAAGQLAADGDALEFDVAGACTFVDTSFAQIKVYYGGTVVYDSGSLGIDGNLSFSLVLRMIRTSSTAMRYQARFYIGSLTYSGHMPIVAYGDISALTHSNANILKITAANTGTGAASDKIIAKSSTLRYFPAP